MKNKLTDIQDRGDVVHFVNKFYEKVNEDDLLSPVFNDFAKVDWENHLPKMYEFWSSILLGTASYRGQPFPKDLPLPVDANHFERWLDLFFTTIDSNFSGEKAEEAKQRAKSIAQIFEFKIRTLKQA